MAHTFRIRRRDGHIYITDGSQHADPGDISLDFNPGDVSHTFNLSPDKVASTIETFLKCIAKVDVQPGLKSVYVDPKNGRLPMWLGVVALVAFIGFAWILLCLHKDIPTLSFVLAAVWTVGVPIYFFWEHEYYFTEHGNPAEFDQFKRVQDLAAKIWAGAIAVLGSILALNNIPH